VQSGNAQFLASSSNILSSQHSSIWGGLVTVGLDLHTTSNTADGFTVTGITQMSAFNPYLCFCRSLFLTSPDFDLRKIGDMNEGVVEGSEDSCNAEDKFT